MMNWNINYWTILFAVTATGWLMATFLTQIDRQKVERENIIPQIDTISRQEAKKRILAYKGYDRQLTKLLGKSVNNPFKKVVDSLKVDNASIQYFRLPVDELNQMVDQFSGIAEYVFAELSLEEASGNPQHKLIDLLFTVTPDEAQSDEVYYFDFTTPCPTFCNPPPPQ